MKVKNKSKKNTKRLGVKQSSPMDIFLQAQTRRTQQLSVWYREHQKGLMRLEDKLKVCVKNQWQAEGLPLESLNIQSDYGHLLLLDFFEQLHAKRLGLKKGVSLLGVQLENKLYRQMMHMPKDLWDSLVKSMQIFEIGEEIKSFIADQEPRTLSEKRYHEKLKSYVSKF